MKTTSSTQHYLSQSIQLEEFAYPEIIRASVLTISCTILLFVAWAAVTNINEVSRTPGEIVPSRHNQIVQHLEGGIVRAIHISEGQPVEEGDLLLELDGAGALQDLDRAKIKQISLSMQEERLRAYIENRPADFSSFDPRYHDLVKDQEFFSRDMINARQQEENVIRDQIRQKSESIRSLQSELATYRSNYAIAEKLFNRRKELHAKGFLSDTRYLEYQQELNALKGDISRTNTAIAVANAEKAEYENRLKLSGADYTNSVNERLDAVLADKRQNTELIEKLGSRVARLAVRAPVSGTVKGLAVNTIGAVAQPGQTLLEIIPSEGPLVAQVKILPRDIAHLKTGQEVKIKPSSYDFSRYGLVEGKLAHISASTFSGENGERYYQGKILLNHDYVGDNPANRITPGMTVMAEIITGEKTILQYLLKPVHRSLKTAFSER